jgi:outer membrane protein OmpA-like peptidoglycan-associated protein
MSTISYGETEPVEKNTSRKGRAQNRRVVVVVLA